MFSCTHLGIPMMMSSNGNIFRVTGGIPSQRPVSRTFDVFFDLRLTKRLSKHSRCRWFETQSRSLWRHCNACRRLLWKRDHQNEENCIRFHLWVTTNDADRADSGLVPSQWETSLQSNVISHWLGTNLHVDSALYTEWCKEIKYRTTISMVGCLWEKILWLIRILWNLFMSYIRLSDIL